MQKVSWKQDPQIFGSRAFILGPSHSQSKVLVAQNTFYVDSGRMIDMVTQLNQINLQENFLQSIVSCHGKVEACLADRGGASMNCLAHGRANHFGVEELDDVCNNIDIKSK